MSKTRFDSSIKIVSQKEIQVDQYRVVYYVSDKNGLFMDVIDKETDSHNYIEGFLHHWDDSDDIKEDLLPMIDSVMNGYSPNEFVSSEISCSYIEKEITYFIYESNISEGKVEAAKHPDRYMPTKIFKDITFKWVEFLESQGK